MTQTTLHKPLQPSGALAKFKYEDTTPEIGREFFNVNIVDQLLNAPNADELLRDLAITSESMLPQPTLSGGCADADQTSLLTTDANQSLAEASSSFAPRRI